MFTVTHLGEDDYQVIRILKIASYANYSHDRLLGSTTHWTFAYFGSSPVEPNINSFKDSYETYCLFLMKTVKSSFYEIVML